MVDRIDWNRQNVCFKFKVKKGKLGKLRDKWKLATVEKIFLYSEDLPSLSTSLTVVPSKDWDQP